MVSKRNDKYDFYKGLLILGVVWGHTITALKFGVESRSWILQFFRTYDMPMFAFISGYFLNKTIQKHSFSKNILNKIGMIMIPVLLWNIIFQIITFNIKTLAFTRFWFLWSIFIVSVMVLVIEKVFSFNKIVKFTVYVTVTIALHTVINLPFNVAFLFIPCIFGVYYDSIKRRFVCKLQHRHVTIIKLALIIAFVVMQIFWDVKYNVWNTGSNIFAFSTPLITSLRIFYRTSIGLIGCVAMKTVFDFLYKILFSKVKIALSNAGKTTLEIYILQSLLVEYMGAKAVAFIANRLGFNIFAVNMFLLDYVFAFVISSVSVFASYYIQKWIKLIPGVGSYMFGISLGRKKQ